MNSHAASSYLDTFVNPVYPPLAHITEVLYGNIVVIIIHENNELQKTAYREAHFFDCFFFVLTLVLRFFVLCIPLIIFSIHRLGILLRLHYRKLLLSSSDHAQCELVY